MPNVVALTPARRREFHEGYNAFMAGNLNNPYTHNTVKYKEYQHGQDVAYLECQKKAQFYKVEA